jgi:magnesium-transporting ATPase (P-type)
VLLFMTLAILVFNFYPVTAVMIVMLALLNDGAILSIAYDNVHHKDTPESWNMRLVLGISTVLATLIAVYGLFMAPLGWEWALFVWGYAIAWALMTDRVKLLAYRIFDFTKTPLLVNTATALTPQRLSSGTQ